MSWAGWLLDGVVVLLLVGLALRLLHTRDLFEAIVLFVAYGLTLALAWMRVGAAGPGPGRGGPGRRGHGGPLPERLAAALGRAQGEPRPHRACPGPPAIPSSVDDGTPPTPPMDPGPPGALLFAGGAAVLAILLVQAPDRAPSSRSWWPRHLAESGVSNPVTAVLLNFRSYDTLLEVAVLVVAMVAVWSMDRGSRDLTREEGAWPTRSWRRWPGVVVPWWRSPRST
jgi:hypothetical protein